LEALNSGVAGEQRIAQASKIGNAFKIDRSDLADWLEERELAAA